MKSKVLLFISVMSIALLSAQNEKEDLILQSLFKAEAGYDGIGLAYEIPIKEKWVIDLSLGWAVYYLNIRPVFSFTFEKNEEFSMFFKSEIKFLYNRKKLFEKEVFVTNNSGSYIAFQTKYSTANIWDGDPEELPHSMLLNEVHWGLQTSIRGGRVLFDLHLGIGYGLDLQNGNETAYPGLSLKFSYIIFKKASRYEQ